MTNKPAEVKKLTWEEWEKHQDGKCYTCVKCFESQDDYVNHLEKEVERLRDDISIGDKDCGYWESKYKNLESENKKFREALKRITLIRIITENDNGELCNPSVIAKNALAKTKGENNG